MAEDVLDRLKNPLKEPSIFLHSVEFVKVVLNTSRRLPKPTRYVLGRMLDEKSFELLLGLNRIVGPSGVRSTERAKRLPLLMDLSRCLDEIRVLFRIAREAGLVSAGEMEELAMRMREIGRQLGGLIRSASG